MRFPSLSDLDREQRRIYGEAPTDGAILIVGPPGTGKTVMAFHRARKLRELGQHPHVIMFGSVLMRYTSSGTQPAADVPVTTMHKWAKKWWMGAFRKWPPCELGSRFDIDWTDICSAALGAKGPVADALDWGHLVIDEGQDFPPEMYITLGIIAKQLDVNDIRPRITVFADDNQRLQFTKNSETADIRKGLFIAGDSKRNFVLRKNFRNTYEIARLASHFEVGQSSGKSELPLRRGELPVVLLCEDDQDLCDFVVRKVKGSPGKQVGVIVHGSARDVTRMYNRITARVGKSRAKAKVQMYINETGIKASSLDFESTDTVTILHQNSAKGLEFDIVFFVGLEKMDLEQSGGINERMVLYVMCSRARSELYLALSELDSSAAMPKSLALLPSPQTKLCKYSGLNSFENSVAKVISGVEWIPPLLGGEG